MSRKLSWPPELIQPYLEDAFINRSWVDDTNRVTREFIANVLTVFKSDDEIAAAAKRNEAAGLYVRQRYPDPEVNETHTFD